jgi:SAM-dependent methyltransferase
VARIDAVDTSPAMLARMTAKAEAHRWEHVRAATTIPATTAAHDLVVCSSVLSFVDDPAATTADLVALLSPGGVFVQWDWELDPADDDPHGLSRDGIRSTLEGAGLVDVEVDTAFELPFGEMTMRPLIGVGRVD